MGQRVNPKTRAVDRVLVVGAGISGMQAALDLAELGIKVTLLEKNTHIGGILSHLDKQFPTNHCGMCRILPIPNGSASSQFCLRRGLKHPNIEILTNVEVEGVSGKAGRFEVSIKKKGSYIDEYKCIGCRRCIEVCPVLQDEQKNNTPDSQKVIHAVSQQNIPYVLVINQDTCTKCGECVKVCPTNAIVLQPEDETVKLTFGSIIHSSGFKEFDSTKLSKYGYKIFKNVITGLELELMMAGEFGRPLDGKVPKKIGFIQCVGSRNARLDLNYCSSVCCMYAMKEALMLKHKYPETEIYIFYIDLKFFGKNHYRYFERAKHEGIEFVRCVPSIDEIPESKNILLTYEKADGTIVRDKFDLIVLSAGFSPPEDVLSLNKIFGINLNKYGFCDTFGVDTSVNGNYVCGSFVEPKDIENSIIEASAAAFKASRVLGPVCEQRLSGKEETPPIHESETEKPRIGIFVCRCGKEISQSIDIDELVNFSRGLTNVYNIEVVDCLCFDSVLKEVKMKIKKSKVNRLIFTACAFHSHKESFEKVIREIGLEVSHLEIVDLREQIAWIHHEKKKATLKAKSLLAMATRKINQRIPKVLLPNLEKIEPKVAVIGAGITGMTVGLGIAEMGFRVDLIEKADRLGGLCTKLSDTLEGLHIQEILDKAIKKVKRNELIHLHKESEVMAVEGGPGNFVMHLKNSQGIDEEIKSGAIVVATGAEEYIPREYLYGKDNRVITQLELEEKLTNNQLPITNYQSVVMIQCVGSLSEKHPYCSRFCCSQAIKNGLKIKKLNSHIEVFILFQEMMTYGFKEEYYAEARNAGVIFVRYPHTTLPNVAVLDNKLEVKVQDTNLHEDLLLNPDLIVLSNGFVPNLEENARLAEILEISLNDDGFFKELDPKFRPLDSSKCGVFICGSAHSPRTVMECITQAQAVSIKVLSFIFNQQERVSSTPDKPFIDADLCCGCGLCVLVCPNGARSINEQRKKSEISHILCQGCGLCGVACPNGATKIFSLAQDQIMAMVDADLTCE